MASETPTWAPTESPDDASSSDVILIFALFGFVFSICCSFALCSSARSKKAAKKPAKKAAPKKK